MKKELYDLASFQRMQDSAGMLAVADSVGGVLLARQLEMVSPTILTKQYADNVLLNTGGIAISNEGAWMNKVVTLRDDYVGEYKKTTDRDATPGIISIKTDKTEINVHEIRAKSIWTDTEVNQASLAGINVVDKFLDGANKLYQQTLEKIFWKGWDDHQDVGLVTNSFFQATTETTVINAGSTLQSDYDTIVKWITSQRAALGGITAYYANKLALPLSIYELLLTKGKFTANNYQNDNVIAALISSYNRAGMGIDIIASPYLDNIGGVKKAVLFSSSQDCLVGRIPNPLNVSPVYQHGFTFETEYKARIAGIDILEGRSGLIVTLA